MKKIIISVFGLLIFLGFGTFAAYQQQGFSQFQELDGNMNFSCTGQCFALIGPMAGSDYITINGTLQGNGMIGYGFVVGQQIIPGETVQINGSATVNQQFSFSKLPMFSQIPANAQIVFMVQGMITSNQLNTTIGFMDFYQKIGQGWKDFWVKEPYGYYSINLLYGPKILGEFATKKFSIWFIIASILLYGYLLYKKEQKKFQMYFMYLAAIFFGILGLRFIMIDAYNIVKTDYQTFISQPDEKKIFRNYNDIYAFDQFIKDNIASGSKINFISYQPWPYPGFSEYQLRPYIQFDTGANILAVYDVGTMKLSSGNLINTQNGTLLFTGIHNVKYFTNFSFIAEK